MDPMGTVRLFFFSEKYPVGWWQPEIPRLDVAKKPCKMVGISSRKHQLRRNGGTKNTENERLVHLKRNLLLQGGGLQFQVPVASFRVGFLEISFSLQGKLQINWATNKSLLSNMLGCWIGILINPAWVQSVSPRGLRWLTLVTLVNAG